MKWSEDKSLVDRARSFWEAGWSARVIADDVSARFGDVVSRNAIIGKMHRLGLSRSTKPRRSKQSSARQPYRPAVIAPAPHPADTPPEPARGPRCAVPADSHPVWITEVRHGQCKWPIYHGRQHLFCGAAAKGGSPYCEAHHKVAYIPEQKRRRETAKKKARKLRMAQRGKANAYLRVVEAAE